MCSRHMLRQWRANNPIKARLAILRDRANRKKLPFDLTFEWFKSFLVETNYNSSLHHIDRISAANGYVIGNLQILLYTDNIAKGNRERRNQLYLC